jgi:DNA-binding LacI/PurR family transcriptional regulator
VAQAKKPLRMSDVARQVGVSRTTVSLVLKGDGGRYHINPGTQQRILDKVAELGYRPNYFARALNLGRTGTIGVVLPELFETYMAELIHGVEDVLYPAGHTLMLSTSRFDPDLERRSLEQLAHRGVDGILLVFTCPFGRPRRRAPHVAELLRGPLPTVLVDRYHPAVDSHRVVQDDEGGARAAVERLLQQGCRRVGYVSFDLDVTSLAARFRGYRSALRAAGLPVDPRQVVLLQERNAASTDLRDALAALFRSRARPDGLLVTTNGLGLKTARLLEGQGLVVGEDVRLARFGSDPEHFTSGLWLVEQPHLEMGRAAARLLLRVLGWGGSRAEGASFEHVVLPPALRWSGRERGGDA